MPSDDAALIDYAESIVNELRADMVRMEAGQVSGRLTTGPAMREVEVEGHR